MPTENFNLPLIADNMANDVVRDMNALAEATDGVLKGMGDSKANSTDLTELQTQVTTHLDESAGVGKRGHVELIDSATSESLTLAPTAKALKFVNDARISHENTNVYSGVHGFKIEEGIWTPTLKNAVVNGTHSYAERSGIYIKQNKHVTVLFTIVLAKKALSASGDLFIDGLPFVVANQNASCTLGLVNCNLKVNDRFATCVGDGVSLRPFVVQAGAGGYFQMTHEHLLDNFVLQGSMTYKTN